MKEQVAADCRLTFEITEEMVQEMEIKNKWIQSQIEQTVN